MTAGRLKRRPLQALLKDFANNTIAILKNLPAYRISEKLSYML